MGDLFAAIGEVADALLYEGYVLYPYRASSGKNTNRWQFGVLMPPGYVADDPSERSSSQTEIVLEADRGATLLVRARFLHAQHRTGRSKSRCQSRSCGRRLGSGRSRSMRSPLIHPACTGKLAQLPVPSSLP